MKIIRAIVVIMLLVSAAAYAQSQNNPGTKQTQFKVEVDPKSRTIFP